MVFLGYSQSSGANQTGRIHDKETLERGTFDGFNPESTTGFWKE